MGLFSSSYRTHVDTAIMRVLEDTKIPETLKASVIQSVMNNAPDMSSVLLEGMLHSHGLRFGLYHHYGQNSYHYGLPNLKVVSAADGESKVKTLLSNQEGYTVTLLYYGFGVPNNMHLAWQHLYDHYGYDTASNELKTLTTQKGYKVYLHNIVPLHPQATIDAADPGVLTPLGPSPKAGYTPTRKAQTYVFANSGMSAIIASSRHEAHTEEAARIETIYFNSDTQTYVRESFIVSLSAYDVEEDYYQTGYTYTDVNNVVHYKWWTYRYGSGTYPELDALYAPNSPSGTFFPFVMFRDRKTNLSDPALAGTTAFDTSVKLLDYLSMDFESVGKTIHDNPDIAQIEQAVMLMGVPATSQDPVELEYLFRFFSRAYLQSPYTAIEVKLAPESIEEALSFEDGHYRMTLSYNGITKETKAGKIDATGAVGSFTNTTDSFTYQSVYHYYFDGAEYSQPYTATAYQRVYRKQISLNAYEEIRVTNPVMRYWVDNKHAVIAKYDDGRLLIPIDKALGDQLGLVQREQLYFRSLHFVFTSKVVDKVKWYETGIFKALLVVVSIVLTVVTFGSAFASIAAATAVGLKATVIAVLEVILYDVLLAVLITEGFKLVVRELGLEEAFYIVIIATAIAVWQGFKTGSIKGAPWAEELLTAANGLVSGIKSETRELIKDYNRELQEFNLMQEEAYEELEAVRESLDVQSLLDPMTFIGLRPLWIQGETADAFYERTIDSGNIGVLALDAIDTFVEDSLKLPTFKSALEGYPL